jgi:hypothetical protein
MEGVVLLYASNGRLEGWGSLDVGGPVELVIWRSVSSLETAPMWVSPTQWFSLFSQFLGCPTFPECLRTQVFKKWQNKVLNSAIQVSAPHNSTWSRQGRAPEYTSFFCMAHWTQRHIEHNGTLNTTAHWTQRNIEHNCTLDGSVRTTWIFSCWAQKVLSSKN